MIGFVQVYNQPNPILASIQLKLGYLLQKKLDLIMFFDKNFFNVKTYSFKWKHID